MSLARQRGHRRVDKLRDALVLVRLVEQLGQVGCNRHRFLHIAQYPAGRPGADHTLLTMSKDGRRFRPILT